MADTVGFAVV